MDVNLESLIEKIKKEAIEEGQQAAQAAVDRARTEAEKLVVQARTEAESIVSKARSEAEKMQENGKMALQQAARDVELALKERLSALFDRVFKRQVGGVLSPQFLENVISKLVTEWSKGGRVEITVDEADKQQLEILLFTKLGESFKDSVTIRVSNAVTKGFRLEQRGGSVYYDFTDETIAAALKAFINPGLQAILNDKDG